jgi:ATP-dependent Clp protease ATP-binding subunit ClpC
MLLQIMEEGRLTDSFGRNVDFRNTILIMTSNIGADLIKGGAGFGFAKRDEQQDYDAMKNVLMKEADRYFRPEFINRLDEIIVFHPLTRVDLETIVDYELRKLRDRLEQRGLELELDEPAKDFLIDKGYNPDFGARPLRRAIGQFVEDPLSEAILRGEFEGKGRIVVTRKEDSDNLFFETIALDKPKQTAAEEEPEPAQAASGGEGNGDGEQN